MSEFSSLVYDEKNKRMLCCCCFEWVDLEELYIDPGGKSGICVRVAVIQMDRFNEKECGCYDLGGAEWGIPATVVLCERHWVDLEKRLDEPAKELPGLKRLMELNELTRDTTAGPMTTTFVETRKDDE